MSLAGLFPGQGAQAVGMLAEFSAGHPEVGETLAEASEAAGLDLARLIAEGPAEELDRTRNAQPALLAAEVAIWRVWRTRGGPEPDWLAGHSFGEYAAWVAAGALGLADAARLARRRGELMQEAAAEGEGRMAAVLGLEDAAAEAVCAELRAPGAWVGVANYNAPGQVVLSGHRAAVADAADACRAAGAKRVVELAVSVPAHSALMEPAAGEFRAALAAAEFRPPRLPVVNNVDNRVETAPERIRDALARQLHAPVRWSGGVRWLAAQGVDVCVEFGPGKILSGLNRRIDRGLKSLSAAGPAGMDAALEALADGK